MKMKLRKLAVMFATPLCFYVLPPDFSSRAAQTASSSSTMRFAYDRDEKIGRWMDELEYHIVFHYLDDETLRERDILSRGKLIDYSAYASRAEKMVKRARKQWGDNDRDTIYVMGVALLVFINYRLKISDISTTEARELVADALIAPPREVFYAQPHAEYLAWKLSALHDLTAARIERFSYNNARAREYYDSAISKFRRLGDMGLTDSLEIIDVILAEMSSDMEANRYFYDR